VARRRGRRAKARQAGYRSGFEHDIAKAAEAEGIKLKFESVTIRYQGAPRRYVPDFKLANGIIVEAKGRFLSTDRTKHLLVKQQHPELDIRFVFMRDNPLNKNSSTRYSDWCNEHGFKYAFKRIPKEWAQENKKDGE
jgi:hypothetical protein